MPGMTSPTISSVEQNHYVENKVNFLCTFKELKDYKKQKGNLTMTWKTII